MKRVRTYRAFTLVELLVVIGIIALLISVLLPALNKARQQANSVACMANEHQMGLLIAEYESENNGWLPYGNTGAMVPRAQAGQYGFGWWNAAVWTWCDTLSIMATRKTQVNGGHWQYNYSWNQPMMANKAYDYLPIFHDKDLATDGWAICASDYASSPRLMPNGNDYDGYFGYGTGFVAPRTAGSVKNSAGTMLVWCTAVTISNSGTDQGGFEVGDQIDNGNIQSAVGMVFPPSAGGSYAYQGNGYSNRIALGTSIPGEVASYSGGDSIQSLRNENKDVTGSAGYFNVSMRFRHMNNNSCNVLFLDGHTESRALGTVVGKDICTNAPTTYMKYPAD